MGILGAILMFAAVLCLLLASDAMEDLEDAIDDFDPHLAGHVRLSSYGLWGVLGRFLYLGGHCLIGWFQKRGASEQTVAKANRCRFLLVSMSLFALAAWTVLRSGP